MKTSTKAMGKKVKKQKGNSAFKVFCRILGDMKNIRGLLSVVVVISLISIMLSLVTPKIIGFLTGELYDLWADGTPVSDKFAAACVTLAIIYVAASVLSVCSTIVNCNATSRYFTYGLRVRISAKILRVPVSFVDRTPTGEILSRMMDDVSWMSSPIYGIVDSLVNGVIKLIGISVIIFLESPLLAAIIVCVVPVSVLVASKLSKRSEKYFDKSREINGKLYSVAEEDFAGFATVKTFSLEKSRLDKYKALSAEYAEKRSRGDYLERTVAPFITFTNALAYILICVIGGYMAINGTLTVSSVVSLVLYAQMFAGPLESIANGFSQIQGTISSARRVYGIFDEKEMTPERDTGAEPKGLDVVFDKVDFSYDPEKSLIKDLSFTAKEGQKVAIVGATGAGKTTIVNLLMRFYEIDSGKITIGGVDIRDMPREKLRSYFSMVLQDTWLFKGTIFENVALGKNGATEKEVELACEKAHIDGYINSQKEGYSTVINEDSANISGGQKQLLTIARAYLADRKILILDEATSNVDTRTELLIQQTMDELMQGRTSFVIAHRLSTVVNADIILVVDGGRIVEKGTHEELLKAGGLYSEIYNSQYELIN